MIEIERLRSSTCFLRCLRMVSVSEPTGWHAAIGPVLADEDRRRRGQGDTAARRVDLDPPQMRMRCEILRRVDLAVGDVGLVEARDQLVARQ